MNFTLKVEGVYEKVMLYVPKRKKKNPKFTKTVKIKRDGKQRRQYFLPVNFHHYGKRITTTTILVFDYKKA